MDNPVSRWLRKRSRKPRKSSKAVDPTVSAFRAVEIEPGLDECCDAVVKVQGLRYLRAQAPSLPLPGCTARHCACHYVQKTDRRAGARRDADYGMAGRALLVEERRLSRRGRRQSDSS